MRFIRILAGAILVNLFFSCGSGDSGKTADGTVLARVGDATFTIDDLQKVMPSGITPEDSAKFVKVFMKGWVDEMLVSQLAQRELGDVPEIDRMVKEYRNRLIMQEYRRHMLEVNAPSGLPDDSLMTLYEQYRGELLTEQPLVKGVFVTVDDDSPSLSAIKKRISSLKPGDIDYLEKASLDKEIGYEYFMDEWANASVLLERLGIDADADAFLKRNKFYASANDGKVMMLGVAEVLHSGNVMPFELARRSLEEIYMNAHRLEQDRMMMDRLLADGIESGAVELNVEL